MSSPIPSLFLATALVSAAVAQDEAQLDATRITSGEFDVERFGPVSWLDGAHYATLETKAGGGPRELVRYEATSGKRDVLLSAAMLWVAAEGRALNIEDYQVSPDGLRMLVFTDSARVWRANTRGEFYVVPLDGSHEPRRLGKRLPKSTLQFAKFSPDGSRVGYVSQNDLYVEDLRSGMQTRLTDDGSDTIINGTFDWVYEEEFDCRDGFRWSPDGTHIAYWQLDCSGVGEFYMVDNLSDRYAQIVPVQYPKAGTTNSACRVGVVPAGGGETTWMKTPGDPRETYVPRMQWHPDGEQLMLQWLPRKQQHLVIYAANAGSGELRKVHEERDEAYVDVRDDFRFVRSGQCLHVTDVGGFRHAAVMSVEPRQPGAQGAIGHKIDYLRRRPTVRFGPGEADLMSVEFVDLDRGRLFGAACDGDATQRYLFDFEPRPQRLTPGDQPGWHDYQISTDGSLAIHTYSSFDSAPVIDLVRLPSHERVRVLVDNQRLRERYAKLAKGDHEFFQVTTADGHRLDGWAMYPTDFDRAKKWPVVFHVYGEPWSQTVKDTWFLRHHLFHRWLTQQGYVVMSLDARGTPAPKGRDWRKALYQNIGVVSSHDWSQAVAELRKQHSWMDADRQAIWGWSGGGAMTLNMLFRYPNLFAAGMSVAPVTDIRLYDTIYQERYCGDPREVPEVYQRCSPIHFAENLKGALLLVHGTGDDNVHFQHSERLFDRLVAHDKQFEYLAYPNRTHAIREGDNTRRHLYGALAGFLHRRLPAGPRE